jgi:hypothetical protein
LLHAGLGRGWWCWSRGFAVADDHRLWVLESMPPSGAGARATPVPLPEAPSRAGAAARADRVDQVGEDELGLVATLGSGRVLRFDPVTGGASDEDHAPQRAVPGGRAAVWVDEEAGFVYRRAAGRTRAIDVVRRGEAVQVGPHGALLLGQRSLTRGGAPGRSPRPLPTALAPDPVRWSADGRLVAGVGEERVGPSDESGGVVLDLATGRATSAAGVPVAIDAWLRGGHIWRGGAVIRRGLVEASAAAWGPWLAGPGGWLWSLQAAQPVARRRVVALGATVGTPSGFVTVDWETGRGWTVGFDGRRRDPFALPLDPDDTVAAGRGEGDAVWFETALGDQFRVVGGVATQSPGAPLDAPMPARILTPAGPFQATVTAELDGRLYAANDDGWLIAL